MKQQSFSAELESTKVFLERLPSLLLVIFAVFSASAQNAHGPAAISKTTSNLLVTWNGVGTLQSSMTLTGAWQDTLEAGSPLPVPQTNSQAFFRVISRWNTNANLIEANSEMGVAKLDGKIYVIGGYPASRVTVNTVQVFDTASNSWQLTTPLLLGVNHPMPAVANGKLYVIGGQTDAGSAYVDTVQEFDPARTNWTYRAPMPTPRSAGAAAVIGNLIYVAGGRSTATAHDFAVYNTTNNTWQTLTNMPTGRNHIAACAIEERVYVVGGRLGGGFTSPMTNILEVFDPATTNWSTLAPMPTTRGGINGIAVNGNFFVFGGEGPDGVFDEMEMYVPTQDRWYELEPLPTAVHGVTGSAYVNGWIHLPGGGTSNGGSSGSTIHQVFWVDGIHP